jgi:hypothetical protein
MKVLSVEDKVTVKSKHLDVLSEYKKSNRKRSANFVVIGKSIFIGEGMQAWTDSYHLKVTLMPVKALSWDDCWQIKGLSTNGH